MAHRTASASCGDVVHPITSAVIAGASLIAQRLTAKLVVIATRSGRTALAKAKERDFIPTVAVCDAPGVLRQMCLYWGITPLAGAPRDLDRDLMPFVDTWGQRNGVLDPGDLVVVLAGTRIREGARNQVVVHEVEASEVS